MMNSASPNTFNAQQGMTLLEVMIALLIFAMTGTAILKVAGDHLGNVGQIESITLANYVASNRLNQLQLDTSWPPKNNMKGSVELADRTWYWQQSVTKTNDDDLRSVAVSVGLSQDYSSTITSVTTFIAKPTSAGG